MIYTNYNYKYILSRSINGFLQTNIGRSTFCLTVSSADFVTITFIYFLSRNFKAVTIVPKIIMDHMYIRELYLFIPICNSSKSRVFGETVTNTLTRFHIICVTHIISTGAICLKTPNIIR